MRILWIFTFIVISVAYADSPRLRDPILQTQRDTIQDIALYMSKINSKLSHSQTLYLAYHIVQNSLKRELDPYLVTSIISVESHFKVNAYNVAGDYSLAQINYRVWSKEFPRLGMEPLCKVTLKKDPAYAIKKMTKILKVLKDRHTNDLKWYSRYHSSTRKFRKLYEKKLEKQFLSLTRAKASVNIGVNETIGGQ